VLSGCLSFHQGPIPGEPPRATFAAIDGARVRYVEVGEGPPVVLIHGFAASLETWDLVIPELRRTHRVIALDLKGFGWTDRPEGDYSPAAQARLVWKLLDERKVSEVAIVAHSWGSSIALAMALSDPRRVSRIALYDAWVYEEQLPTFFTMARADGVGEILFSLFYDERPDERIGLAFYDERFVTERLVEDVERALERPGTKAAALAAVRGQRYAEVQKKYGTIRQPVLLQWGREDLTTTLEAGEVLAKQLPNASLVVYPRCGHFPMLEAAAASNRRLVEFLAEGGSPSGSPKGPPGGSPGASREEGRP
jgi:pimeloyl-ACP methyl ester carboxylesterase